MHMTFIASMRTMKLMGTAICTLLLVEKAFGESSMMTEVLVHAFPVVSIIAGALWVAEKVGRRTRSKFLR